MDLDVEGLRDGRNRVPIKISPVPPRFGVNYHEGMSTSAALRI